MNYSQIIKNTSALALYYRLNDSGSTATDVTGSNTGSYVSTNTQGVAGALYGDSDAAVTFGASGYINAGTLGSFGSNMGSGVSVEFWIKSTNTTTVGCVFGTSGSGSKPVFRLNWNQPANGIGTTSGKWRVQISDNSATTKTFAYGPTNAMTNANDGNWHHMVITALPTSNTATAYFDGTSVALTNGTSGSPNTFINFPVALYVGCVNVAGTATTFFNQTLDEFALYSRVLTADEALWHYREGKGFLNARMSMVA